MLSERFFKNLRLIPLLGIPLFAWLLLKAPVEGPGDFSPAAINLALRRTADGLLRMAGDSSSRIPAIEQISDSVWQIRLEKPFSYEQFPGLLQSSLDLHRITRPYTVAVRKCADASIDLGYHKFDFSTDNNVPCSNRDMPDGCHFIEVTFLGNAVVKTTWAGKAGIFLLILAALVGLWFYRGVPGRQTVPASLPATATDETVWLDFGNSRLDVAGQILLCAGHRQTLTFREAKLLRLFATSPDRLLERDYILQQVWADEGVLVGRSVDVFVSRLRKKIAADTSLGIVAVHGVGYRLETGK